MKTDIEHIASDLSYTKEEVRAIFKRNDEADSDEEKFNNYEAELIRLKKLHIAATPILDLVRQREEIIQEYNTSEQQTAQAEPAETSEPGKRKVRPQPPDPSEKGRIERIRRRYKLILPRVEGKLKVLLEQFREQGGVDFTWKGQKLIEELKDVPVPHTERVRKPTGATTATSRRTRASVAPSGWAATGGQKPGSPLHRRSVGTGK
jgi:hypothetical protein